MKKAIAILIIILIKNTFAISEKSLELIEKENSILNEQLDSIEKIVEEKQKFNFVETVQKKQELIEKENTNQKTTDSKSSKQKIEIIDFIKSIAEISYYIAFCIIGFFTYMGARKTLFLPFDNEVFKFQIKEMQEVYRYSTNFEKLYKGFEKNIYLNLMYLMNDYIEFNEWKETNLNFDKNEFFKEVGYSTLMDENDLNIFVDEHKSKEELKLNNWCEYKLKLFYISAIFQEEEKKLEEYTNTPFLPKNLLVELKNTLKKVEHINILLKEKILQISQELPTKVQKTDDMKRIILMLYNDCITIVVNNDDLEKSFEKILKIIRENLNSDNKRKFKFR
ncbi:hypothetical protein [Cetobacterium sp. ZOR0034]|uniref:hypothetical protein n=1 Tax=Cetobacterium sp. ZOR0034 TaxID=1339239 RepID=UPI0006484791|nr:hypothetical protein [Cetobacterium sp. ZOR0034]